MSARRDFTALLVGVTLSSCFRFGAAKAAAAPRHIRGTITAYQDQELTVEKTRGGSEKLKIGDDTGIFLVQKSDLAAIKPNQFVGVTSVEENGKRIAREVHVFAEDLRGLGEGHYPWDLDSAPNMMTNANIAKVEDVGKDRVLELNYAGGEQTIAVPEDAAVVSFQKTSTAQLVSGRKVFVLVNPDRGDTAAGVVVGAEGVKPPM